MSGSRREHSYGVVPLRRSEEGVWDVLLIRHQAGHWAFPKGHPKEGETSLQTAERELLEETGMRIVRWISEAPIDECYSFHHQDELIDKIVSYFPAEVEGTIIVQEDELSDACWAPLSEARERITHRQARNICARVTTLLSTLK